MVLRWWWWYSGNDDGIEVIMMVLRWWWYWGDGILVMMMVFRWWWWYSDHDDVMVFRWRSQVMTVFRWWWWYSGNGDGVQVMMSGDCGIQVVMMVFRWWCQAMMLVFRWWCCNFQKAATTEQPWPGPSAAACWQTAAVVGSFAGCPHQHLSGTVTDCNCFVDICCYLDSCWISLLSLTWKDSTSFFYKGKEELAWNQCNFFFKWTLLHTLNTAKIKDCHASILPASTEHNNKKISYFTSHIIFHCF